MLTLSLSVGVSADDVTTPPDDINIESTTATNDGSVVDDNIDINSGLISTELIESENSTRSQASGIVSGAVYRIKNAGSGKYMNVHNGVDANGTNIYQWTGDGSTAQKFKIVYFADSDAYLIYAMCSSSGRVLDIYDPGGVLAHGENVKLHTATEPNSQLVKIVSLGQNQYRISMKTNSNLYLAAYGNSNGTSGGTTATSAGNIYLSSYVGEMYQHWMFELVENPPNPTGNLEEVSASRIKGWAYQTGLPDTPIDVHVYIKNNSTGAQNTVALTANQYRADLQSAGYGDGEHAFNHTMNWCPYPSGTYTVSAYGINNNGGTNPHLPNSPRTFTVRKATGAMDEINDSLIRGWAWKPDAPNDSIQVHLYIRRTNGETVYQTATIANAYRADLYNAGYGDGYHGYSIPIDWSSLPKERLRVTLYAVDGSNENPAFYDVYHDKRLPIYHIGIIDDEGIDFSAWTTQEIVNYSYNIGAPDVVRCIGFTKDNLCEYIRQSRFATVYTHGYKTSLTWSKNNTDNPQSGTITWNEINGKAGTHYFDNTECLLLMACEAGNNDELTGLNNVAKAFRGCGVQSVVAFEGKVYSAAINNKIITTERAGLWAKIFVRELGNGASIENAKNTAWQVMFYHQLEMQDKSESQVEALSITNPEYVDEYIYCGMNTCVIFYGENSDGTKVIKK